MKGLFPQYDDLAAKNYSIAWKQALFVFDTNVLLNLYRYQVGTRDELLEVLRKLSGRVWIPHHVALEFQRNRLKVIAEQAKQFTEVRRTIEKSRGSLSADLEKLQLNRRHSRINPEPLLSGFDKLVEDFLSELSRLQESQQKLTEPDPLKALIEALFDGRVGSAPVDQGSIDDLYKKAEHRFKLKIPPGYQDAEKDKDGPDEHVHGGIVYKRKYGDYLVWHQLLAHAKASGSKAVIFVTDDGKEDWWRKIDSDGPKTIGPRPELIEEAAVEGQVDSLLMYNPEGFLKYAKEFLQAQVSEETLKEVRDVSTTTTLHYGSPRDFQAFAVRAERAVMQWLASHYSSVDDNSRGYPDFVAERDGKIFGFDVQVVRNINTAFIRLREATYRAYYALKEGGFSGFAIVWVVNSAADVDKLRHMLYRAARDEMPENLRIIIGVYSGVDDPEASFVPCADFFYNEAIPSLERAAYGRC